MRQMVSAYTLALLFALFAERANGDTETIGVNGIDAAGLGLTGDMIPIGMVESERPGLRMVGPDLFDMANLVHSGVTPTEVYLREGEAVANMDILDPMQPGFSHAVAVAGVMISTEPITPGVAPAADLYASAYRAIPDVQSSIAHAVLSMQRVAMANGGDMRAINLSFAFGGPGVPQDGSDFFSLAVDWSAHVHDVLYVAGGPQDSAPGLISPNVHFNGITVASSKKVGNTWRMTDPSTTVNMGDDASGIRTSIHLLAPGDTQTVTSVNDVEGTTAGASFAAPHVTGTVALLQEFAEQQIGTAPANQWNANARRHQVMKAVLLNSADKVMPFGNDTALGMPRDVEDTQGNNWFASPASTDVNIPLDMEMGAGHLNARRAQQQFAPGEVALNANGESDVGLVGWDWGNNPGPDIDTFDPGITKYKLTVPLTENSSIAATLVWDREPVFNNDRNGNGQYDAEFDSQGVLVDEFATDSWFTPSTESETFNNMDLYLMPAGQADLGMATTSSQSIDMNLEHFFFSIDTPGMYELWVVDYENNIGPDGTQDYAIAWWADTGMMTPVSGDYNGDTNVDAADYTAWKSSFGDSITPGTAGDGNSDGIVNAADYTLWRDNLGSMSGAGNAAAVPEPSASFLMLAIAIVALLNYQRQFTPPDTF